MGKDEDVLIGGSIFGGLLTITLPNLGFYHPALTAVGCLLATAAVVVGAKILFAR